LKATAYGVYYTSVGLATLVSLAFAGWLWDNYGSNLPFMLASAASLILAVALYLKRKSFGHF
ncbi:MAG: hypothetical protein QG567_2052, partial [Campylobacterota bacterium]|nr:hypothetical protein [Campylobacterota bacterium]